MNTITRQTATEEQQKDIDNYIFMFMDIIRHCWVSTQMFDLPMQENIKMILGFGVKSGALGKFENLNTETNKISFDVWIRINPNPTDSGIYFKVKTVLDLVQKQVYVNEY